MFWPRRVVLLLQQGTQEDKAAETHQHHPTTQVERCWLSVIGAAQVCYPPHLMAAGLSAILLLCETTDRFPTTEFSF